MRLHVFLYRVLRYSEFARNVLSRFAIAHAADTNRLPDDIGLEQLLEAGDHSTRVSADVYRTNLRTPSQRYLPAVICHPGNPQPACESYPINIGNAVYTGAEMRFAYNVDRRTVVRLGYGIDSAYPKNVLANVQSRSLVVGGAVSWRATSQGDRIRPA